MEDTENRVCTVRFYLFIYLDPCGLVGGRGLHMNAGAHGGQRSQLPLELESGVIVNLRTLQAF